MNIGNEVQKIFAFFIRDFKEIISYRSSFIVSIVDSFLLVFGIGLFGTAVMESSFFRESVESYKGMSFITFIFVGWIFQNFANQGIISPEKVANSRTIEWVLMAPVKLHIYLGGTLLWGYFRHILNMFIFLLIGVAFFGMNLTAVNWLLVTLALLLVVISTVGFGIIGAGITLVTKRWNPISWFFAIFSFFISGVMFDPIQLNSVDSSGMLYSIAQILPQTHAFRIARLAFTNTDLANPIMINELLSLLLITFVVLPTSVLLFKKCLDKCRSEGSLGWA